MRRRTSLRLPTLSQGAVVPDNRRGTYEISPPTPAYRPMDRGQGDEVHLSDAATR